MELPIKTADELLDAELEGQWAARRHERAKPVLQWVLRWFVERGEPLPIERVPAAFPDQDAATVTRELAHLHDLDLLWLRDGRVDLAYPFSGLPTAFAVTLAGGAERYACCALDAVGLAPMLGQRVDIRSVCHHCGEPLAFSADPAGPEPASEDVMLWIGKRGEGQRRLCETL
jgi:hypothetical protein